MDATKNAEEVILCSNCAGRGRYYEQVNAYEDELVSCYRCEGSGRVIKTVTIEYKPFSDGCK